MKKILLKCMIGVLVLAGPVMLGQQSAYAGTGIKGNPCSQCHTMHNSMDGTEMALTGTDTNEALLKDTCLGCHSSTDASAMTSAGIGAPVVLHNAVGGPATPGMLAGGDFYYLKNGGSDTPKKGHNVDVVNAELSTSDAMVTPPGNTGSFIAFAASDRLGCANGASGIIGCHEYGGHHANTGGAKGTDAVEWADGTSRGDSYRFLRAPDGGTANYVKGGEVNDWEYNVTTAEDHNVYYAGDGVSFDSVQSISALCAACHGLFHGNKNDANVTEQTSGYDGPWVRHPTDFPISDVAADKLTYYTANLVTYDATVPIGTATDDYGPGVAVTTGDFDGYDAAKLDMVLCVSCHRVHGSPYDRILRWDYTKMLAGDAAAEDRNKGCFKCHSDKDGD